MSRVGGREVEEDVGDEVEGEEGEKREEIGKGGGEEGGEGVLLFGNGRWVEENALEGVGGVRCV